MSIIVRIAFFGQPKPVRAIAGQPGCADPRGATEADGALFRPRP